uniref:Uncharacterized protein n=1 Tax=uncultured marine virus TaxID=186617 RepID=A0A0F7LAQ4_9VIRU|nr:hypothetical protein [uncultured marine virus]
MLRNMLKRVNHHLLSRYLLHFVVFQLLYPLDCHLQIQRQLDQSLPFVYLIHLLWSNIV